MAKPTKAEIILKGARERVRCAQEDVVFAEGKLDVHVATLRAHQFALEQLEKDLAQTSRKVKDPKSTAPVASKRSSRKSEAALFTASTEGDKENAGSASNRSEKQPICVICGNEETYADHQAGAANRHVFHISLKKKNSKDNGGTVLPDDQTQFQHEATA